MRRAVIVLAAFLVLGVSLTTGATLIVAHSAILRHPRDVPALGHIHKYDTGHFWPVPTLTDRSHAMIVQPVYLFGHGYVFSPYATDVPDASGMPDNAPHRALRNAVTGRVMRGEAEPITEVTE